MIPESRLELALVRLAESDEVHADAKMEMLRSEAKVEAIRDAVYLVEEGSIEDRKAKARSSHAYKDAFEHYLKAVRIFTSLTNKRSHEMMIVDVFRTLEASRRKGNI